MEINKCSSAVNMYKKIGSDYKAAAKKNNTAAVNTGAVKNVDKVEISSAARVNAESAKAAVKRAVEQNTSSDRIAALKAKIADGSYSVSPENVAAAIFEG